MAKLALTDLASAQASSIVAVVNANNALIEAALEKTLSRDGANPNSMEDVLDMNNERIINLPEPVSASEPLRKGDFDKFSDALAALSTASAQAVQALDDFTDLYLGVFASDPTLDNDGDPLQNGAIYYNSSTNRLKVYNTGVWSTPLSGTVVDSTDIGVTPSGADVSLSINANAVTDAELRQGGATSVIGRSANSTGNVADIAASADGQFLYRATGTLGFQALTATLVANTPAGSIAATNVQAALNELAQAVTVLGLRETTPAAFVHRAGVIAYRKSSIGHAEIVTDLRKFFPAGWFIRNETDVPGWLKAYRVSRLGNNSDGLTWATAYTSIQTALAQADVDVVLVDGRGRYTINQPFGTYAASRDVAVISVGGRASISGQTEETWSAGVQPHTFTSTTLGGTPVDLIDVNVRRPTGGYTPLQKLATEALVSATPGSWCQNGSGGSSTATVRLYDDATPTNDRAWILRSSVSEFAGTGSSKFYVHGIDFVGGTAGAFRARNSTITANLTMSECGFYNSYNGDGLDILDVGLVTCIKCKADYNFNDGFNYHVSNSLDPHFIEIDCVGTGGLAVATGNGSSAHDNVRGIRINCDYSKNLGPGISDVGTSKTFNVCCTSTLNGPDSNAWGVKIANTAECWLDGLFAEGNATTQIGALDTATIHYRNSQPVPSNVSGTAVIDGIFT